MSLLDTNVNSNFNDFNSFLTQQCSTLNCDTDTKNVDTIQSASPYEYLVSNNYHKNHTHQNNVEFATQHLNINFSDGFGVNPDVIQDEKKAGKVQVFNLDKNQLFTRPFLTIPYMGKGKHHVDNESSLLSGETTTQKRQCNSLAGVYLENQFTPLLDNLKETIQNPQHIIPENSNINWIRGGIDTTQIAKDIDYFQRCTDSEEVKNGLINKKGYLKNKLEPLE
jgi:hypothetical protein